MFKYLIADFPNADVTQKYFINNRFVETQVKTT